MGSAALGCASQVKLEQVAFPFTVGPGMGVPPGRDSLSGNGTCL